MMIYTYIYNNTRNCKHGAKHETVLLVNFKVFKSKEP